MLESTYGDRVHEGRRQRQQRLQQVLERTLENRGTTLISAFSLGRTQELLYELNAILGRLERKKGTSLLKEVDVIVDSPLAARFTEVYQDCAAFWDGEAHRRLQYGDQPLVFENLMTVGAHEEHRWEVEYLQRRGRAAIVLAGSGMCTGGRVVNYLKALMGDRRTDVVLVGYQARGTPGRAIQEGRKSVTLEGKRYAVRAGVHTLSGYSAHADQRNLVDFVTRMRHRPREVVLVHGERSAREGLQQALRERFAGLWIEGSDYTWEEHPVVRMDFSLFRVHTAEELTEALQRQVSRLAQSYQVRLGEGAYYERFADLIRQLAARHQVVVLVDEYDKPIIDNLENEAEARRIREVLKGFYGVLKGLDEYLRFVLLTGVSKFSKVGVFSGLNNLKDITLDDRYAALLGITQEEVDTCFAAHLQAFAESAGRPASELRVEIRRWYNGFCFSKGCLSVYNPFSLLLLFDTWDFRHYWFESGTPTFLIQQIRQQQYEVQALEQLQVNELAFGSYEVERLDVVPLLFQTGYLTIKGYDPRRRLYTLSYPNFEVEESFLQYLMGE